jgi:hypothetical protein
MMLTDEKSLHLVHFSGLKQCSNTFSPSGARAVQGPGPRQLWRQSKQDWLQSQSPYMPNDNYHYCQCGPGQSLRLTAASEPRTGCRRAGQARAAQRFRPALCPASGPAWASLTGRLGLPRPDSDKEQTVQLIL